MTDVDNFLAHYGVKGMKWGVRRDTILNARASRSTKEEARKTAEAEYVKSYKSGSSDLASKKKALDDAHRDANKNHLTSVTLTRGEQIVSALLLAPLTGGVGSIGFAAGNALGTRDGQKLGEVNYARIHKRADRS